MEFDFTMLNLRIAEKFSTRETFADALGLSKEKLSRILDDQIHFTFSEIVKSAELLSIAENEIIEYFFTPKVR